MTDNPYNSPNSQVESESHRTGSLWKGILFGGLADLGGTIVMSIIMISIYMALNWSADMTPEKIEEVTNMFVEDSSSFNNIWGIIGLVFGLGFSVLGGYICALFAREKWKKAILILAAILTIYGLVMGSDIYQIGVLLVLTLLSIFAMLLGGWLRGGKRY